MQKSRIQTKIKKLPKSPGVYIFKDNSGVVLYVGKATSLRDRVRSYFPPMSFSRKRESSKFSGSRIKYGMTNLFDRPVETAIGQIEDIKIIETDTVLEAFILEQDMIKRLQPKYNAMGKDDKSFSYVVVTKEKWPRIIIMRGRELEKIQNSKLSKARLFPPDKKFVGTPQSQAFIKIQNNGIYGPYTSKKQIEIALNILRKIFPYHSKTQKSEKGCLDSQIGLCPGPYDGKISRADYLKNVRGIKMILEGKKKGLIKKLEKEMKVYSKEHAYEKAAEARNKIFALKHIRDVAMISGNREQKFLFPTECMRIEAYDISNISGQYAVGSMVVFDNYADVGTGHGLSVMPNKNEYRKFKIRTIQGADDVGMMREILSRRFGNNWPRPDLILLDGGIGQLGAGEKVLSRVNLKIPMIAVTKGKDRKIFNFQFSIFNQFSITKFSNEIIKNRNLIKQIMDEAHRFAITYHKKIRKGEFIKN